MNKYTKNALQNEETLLGLQPGTLIQGNCASPSCPNDAVPEQAFCYECLVEDWDGPVLTGAELAAAVREILI